MILVRRLLGDVLRRRRLREGRTLRQLAASARVSPGYLSEIERGQKEPSSELLASICAALGVRLSDVLLELSTELAAAELAAAEPVTKVGLPAGDVLPTALPTAKIGGAARTPVGAKPGAKAATRPAPRPVTRPVNPRVPVAATNTVQMMFPGAGTAPAASPASGPGQVVLSFGPFVAV